jgi:hypothetical protein
MGKIQPFLLSMSTNAVLVMDFHCHLTTSEVVGYLAGHWDVNAHSKFSNFLNAYKVCCVCSISVFPDIINAILPFAFYGFYYETNKIV